MSKNHTITSLDIGHHTIKVLIAEQDSNGNYSHLGEASCSSQEFGIGIHKGRIVNVEIMRELIQSVVDEAEQKVGCTITELYVSLSGIPIKGFDHSSTVYLDAPHYEIEQEHIHKLRELGKNIPIPLEEDFLHVLPKGYELDGEDGHYKPLGMKAHRLVAKLHLVTVLKSVVANLTTAVERSGRTVRHIFLGSLASSAAILNENEKESGVLLIDIGACSSDFIVFHHGIPQYTGSVAVGGAHATSDLSLCLEISEDKAEELKCFYGSCWATSLNPNNEAFVPSSAGFPSKRIAVSEVVRILTPRMEELFELISMRLGRNYPVNNVVLTGGGAMLDGSSDLARHIYGVPVREAGPKIAIPLPDECYNPCWSTAAGLIQLAKDFIDENNSQETFMGNAQEKLKNFAGFFGKLF